MSSYYIEAIVHQTIPCECVKPVEAWLLTRLFKTKLRHVKTEIKHDRFCFSAGWMLDDLDQGAFSSDGKLTKAIAASRKVCPELCAEVEHEIDSGGNIRLGMIDYKKIFQSIVRRHSNRLPHVSILEFLHSTDRVQYLEETFTLITAGAIEALKTRGLPLGESGEVGCVRGERLFRAFLVVHMVSLIMHVVDIQNLIDDRRRWCRPSIKLRHVESAARKLKKKGAKRWVHCI